jgi:GTP-binding protein
MVRAAAKRVVNGSGLPVVAIIGRPNVGKSTLFNRLAGARKAIVDDFPGVTRDRNYAQAEWAGRKYLMVDTGGIQSAAGGKLEESVQGQSQPALREADIVVFLLDGKSGLNPLDQEVVNVLRKANKPVFFAVNKLDSARRAENLFEFYALGLDPLYAISAEHGLGIGARLDDVTRHFPDLEESAAIAGDGQDQSEEEAGERDEALRVAVVGRPNVGKSTLINRLVGRKGLARTSNTPGRTRRVHFYLVEKRVYLVDLPGYGYAKVPHEMRDAWRPLVEKFAERSVLKLFIVLVDLRRGPEREEAELFEWLDLIGVPSMLVLTKADKLSKAQRNLAAAEAKRLLKRPSAPLTFSALSGDGVPELGRAILAKV